MNIVICARLFTFFGDLPALSFGRMEVLTTSSLTPFPPSHTRNLLIWGLDHIHTYNWHFKNRNNQKSLLATLCAPFHPPTNESNHKIADDEIIHLCIKVGSSTFHHAASADFRCALTLCSASILPLIKFKPFSFTNSELFFLCCFHPCDGELFVKQFSHSHILLLFCGSSGEFIEPHHHYHLIIVDIDLLIS